MSLLYKGYADVCSLEGEIFEHAKMHGLRPSSEMIVTTETGRGHKAGSRGVGQSLVHILLQLNLVQVGLFG